MDKEDVVYVRNRILFSHKKNEILQFATTRMNLEGIMLKWNVRQRKTNTLWIPLNAESKKQNKLTSVHNKIETELQIHRTNK